MIFKMFSVLLDKFVMIKEIIHFQVLRLKTK